MSDPAAAPLGADSEASGVRQGEGSMEPAPAHGHTATHPAGHARGTYERGSGRWVWMTAAAAVGLLFGLMVFVVTVA